MTVFPSHFNNIFLQSFGLLQTLMRNWEILQYLMRFHETNDISQNFSGITLAFMKYRSILLTFSFAFGTFYRWLQNFGFVCTDLKFQSFQFGESLKSQYCSYPVSTEHFFGQTFFGQTVFDQKSRYLNKL